MTAAGVSLLRLYLLAGDRMEGRPASGIILEAARALDAQAAWARTGIAGFGRHGLEVDLIALELRPDRLPVTVHVLAPAATLLQLLATLQARGLPNREVVLEPPLDVRMPAQGHP
jgi:PII-like signaling protein